MSTISIPKTHDDLTAEWLTSMLHTAGVEATVGSFTRRPMGEGVGMMAALELVDLDYTEGEGPRTIVVKLKAVNEGNRAVALAFDLYRREVMFYRDIAERTSTGTPNVLLAEVDGSADFALVLEDLSAYRLGDQIAGCDLADAEKLVTALGHLHAPFWGRVDAPEFEFVPYETPSVHGNALRDGAVAGWDPMVAAFGDAVTPELLAVKGRFLAATTALQQWLVTAPSTIVHGDFRMDNLFFGQQPDHHEAVVIDWQGSLRSKGARDVAYLLSQSMPTELRREHERDLVEGWRRTLVDGGVTDYSAEEAWEDYRRSVLALWIVVVVIAGTLDSSNERGKAWMTEMVRRSAATIADLHLLDLLPEFEGPASPQP